MRQKLNEPAGLRRPAGVEPIRIFGRPLTRQVVKMPLACQVNPLTRDDAASQNVARVLIRNRRVVARRTN
jgi:hypothetical protein